MASPSPNFTRRLYHGDALPVGATLAGYGLAIATMYAVGLLVGGGRLEIALAQVCGLGLVPLALARVHGVPLAALGLARPRVGPVLGAALAGAGLWLIALTAAAPVVEATAREPEIRAWSATLFGGRPPWLEIALAIVIVPALCEELTHRGLLAAGLTPALGRAGAVVASTLPFALLHLEPARMVATAILSLAAGAVAAWSRSLAPAVTLHAVNNAIVAALSLDALPWLRRVVDEHHLPAVTAAAALSIAGLAVARATSPRPSATVGP